MCGIVGFINRESVYKDKESIVKWFNQALYCDALRGKHGTGVVAVNDKGDVLTYKRALPSSDFIDLEPAKKIINDNSNIFMIGHNRYATKGSHTNENTHPFSHGDIHMVHNGTVNNYYSLTKGAGTFNVDSDALAFYLSQKADVSKALEEVSGAYSLVWYDEILETLNFARNDERPMFLGNIKGSDSVIFASEKGMLEWLANRNGIFLDTIVSLKAGVHLAIPLDPKDDVGTSYFTPKKNTYYNTTHRHYLHTEHTDKKNVVHLPKKQTEEKPGLIGSYINFVVDRWVAYGGTGNLVKGNGFMKGKWGDFSVILPSILLSDSQNLLNKTIRSKIVNVTTINDEQTIYVSSNDMEVVGSEESISLPVLLKGPNKKVLTHKQFDEFTKHGCSLCSCTLTKDMHNKITWDSQDNPFCEECSNDFKEIAFA